MDLLGRALGPRAAGATPLPTTGGGASAPTGSDIVWQRIDPKTWYLYNLTQSSPGGAFPAPPSTPPPAPTLSPATAARAEGERSNLAVGDPRFAAMAAGPMEAGPGVAPPEVNPRRQLKALDTMLKGQGVFPDNEAAGFDLLTRLVEQGIITLAPGSSGTSVPLPGGRNARNRLVEFIDRYRPWLPGGQ
jgi:hypothetical protein